MELLDQMTRRRSVRSYTEEAVPEEALDRILKAGLLAPSGKNKRPWEFILVRGKETLQRLSECRPAGAGILAHADAAIVVLADPLLTDVWTEDCCAAMTQMHLMADALGIGSCWVQVRLRPAPDGGTAEDFIKALLRIPDPFKVEAILCLGMPAAHPAPHTEDQLPLRKIHREAF